MRVVFAMAKNRIWLVKKMHKRILMILSTLKMFVLVMLDFPSIKTAAGSLARKPLFNAYNGRLSFAVLPWSSHRPSTDYDHRRTQHSSPRTQWRLYSQPLQATLLPTASFPLTARTASTPMEDPSCTANGAQCRAWKKISMLWRKSSTRRI